MSSFPRQSSQSLHLPIQIMIQPRFHWEPSHLGVNTKPRTKRPYLQSGSVLHRAAEPGPSFVQPVQEMAAIWQLTLWSDFQITATLLILEQFYSQDCNNAFSSCVRTDPCPQAPTLKHCVLTLLSCINQASFQGTANS